MMIERVKKTIRDHEMIDNGDAVLLCVSGGVDSMALLDIFLSIRDALDLTLSLCHLNHNLRSDESVRDQSFVEKVAAEKGLAFFTKTLGEGELKEAGGSLQESAREARYAFFTEAAGELGATRIALAHNSDDQSETVLMRILKGTSLKGLRGIPPIRGSYIRPLIEVSRGEIESYVKENNVEFVEDSSNESTKYLRNKLRLELIPLLEKEYNPAVKEALNLISLNAGRDYSFIESKAKGLFDSAKAKEEESEARFVFSREMLSGAHPALSTRVFLMAVEALKGDARGFYSAHVEAFLNLLASDDPASSVDLPGGLRLRRVYEEVVIESIGDFKSDNAYEVELIVPGDTLLGDTGSSLSCEIIEGPVAVETDKSTALFDLDVLESPLLVRTFRAGDRMTPLGLEGTKKVHDIFVDDKVARLMRKDVPLLVSGDEVLWIAGLRQSNRAKLTSKTRRTLRIEYKR